jgi:hypothetical protein
MQLSQSKILRMITNAPWYVTNQTLHEDLNVPYITEVVHKRSIKHHDKIQICSNTTSWPLVEQQHRRRLRKSWPVDLIDGWRGPPHDLMAPTRATTQKKVKKTLASRAN